MSENGQENGNEASLPASFPPASRVAPGLLWYEYHIGGLDRYVKQYGASV